MYAVIAVKGSLEPELKFIWQLIHSLESESDVIAQFSQTYLHDENLLNRQ